MIKSKNIVLVGGAALLYFGVLRGAKSLYLGIKDYHFKNLDLMNQTVDFVIRFLIKNTLFVGVRIKSLTGNIYIQGEKVGTINANYDKYLAGNTNWDVDVPISIDMKNLAQAVVNNILSGDIRTLTIMFDGAIVIGGTGLVRVPFKKTLNWDDIAG